MALTANKVPSDPVLTHRTVICTYHEKHNLSMSTIHIIQLSRNGRGQGQLTCPCLLAERSTLYNEGLQCLYGKPFSFISKKSYFLCKSSGANNTEQKECDITSDDVADITRNQTNISKILSRACSPHAKAEKADHIPAGQGLAGTCRLVYNDANFVNDRAHSDIFSLSRGMMSMEARARQDFAFLGAEFLKLDARAREDTKRIDHKVKEKAKHLHHIATILKDKAQSRLKSAADDHWSDGALKADLHLADFRVKQRAMEDALIALEFAKNLHDMMGSKMYKFPLPRNRGSRSANNVRGCIMLQKNGQTISTDCITAIQEAYWSMASALSEADGIDYADPEELELLITTLIDLDAMDGKQSVSLLAECSSSPNVSTRQALASALAKAPSMWTLGNAGMGALQRLAEDSYPAVAAAASRAIYELKKQWEIEEGYNSGKTKQPRI